MNASNTLTDRERAEIAAANAANKPTVVFIHGLWLHASSWNSWAIFFREAGFSVLTPGWPDDPETVEESRANPDRVAGKGLSQITSHLATIVSSLKKAPILIGHSLGGLLVQKLLGEGYGSGGVAIDAAPFRGVLPLPFSTLKATFPVLGNPGNRKKAMSLNEKQFRYAFANAVEETEAKQLFESFAIPAPARPLFQAATANIDSKTEATVETRIPSRGPLLLVSGEKDHTVPGSIVKAAFKRYRKSTSVTEMIEFPNRGHSLTIDSGWKEIAEFILGWIKQQKLT